MKAKPFLRIAVTLLALSLLGLLWFGPTNLFPYVLLFLAAMSFVVHLCDKEVSSSSTHATNGLL